jgi:hypothetical protein
MARRKKTSKKRRVPESRRRKKTSKKYRANTEAHARRWISKGRKGGWVSRPRRRKKSKKRHSKAPKRTFAKVSRLVRRVLRVKRADTFALASTPFLIRHYSRSTPGKVEDRLAVVVEVDGRNIAFYRSTGTGTPSRVKRGTWVPFNGISRRGGGWFIKMPGKVPTGNLAEASRWLNSRITDRPDRVFDDKNGVAAWGAQVNSYLAQHGAFYAQGGGPFQEGTRNFRANGLDQI